LDVRGRARHALETRLGERTVEIGLRVRGGMRNALQPLALAEIVVGFAL
jgi:hypothetical protein